MNISDNYSVDLIATVISELIEENTQTTTLEVKNELRRRGYVATQNTVSIVMDSLVGNAFYGLGGLVFDDVTPTRPHRIYYIGGKQQPEPSLLERVRSVLGVFTLGK